MDLELDPTYPAVVTAFALLLYFVSILFVAYVRTKYKIEPPTMTGPDEFNRGMRVHQNTLEHLALFLPAMWLYAYYISSEWAAIIGAVWIAARLVYCFAYLSAANRRLPPFILSVAAQLTLLIGGLIGAVQSLMA